MKVFSILQSGYEGLKVKRLNSTGRLMFYEVMNDPPRYWLLYIKNYHPEVDGPNYGWFIRNTHIPSQAAGWRFLEKGKAQAKFEELSKLPCCLADEEKSQKLREKSKQRLAAYAYRSSTLARET